MKAKFGAIVVDGRGKLGGHVFSKNRSGAIVRTKVTPINRNTAAQIAARNSLTTFTVAWKGLTAAQRSAWNSKVNDYKKTNIFGDNVNPSGKSLFMMLNLNLALVGVAMISVPPTPASVTAMTSITPSMAAGAATASVAFTPTPVAAGNAFLLFASAGLSPGISYCKSQYRKIAMIDAAAASPFNAKASYEAVFGAIPAAGQKVFFKVVAINKVTGQRGAELSNSCIVAA